ncbi:TetR/AcrR family transcriptional regulator [Seonamhaeicola maritimus]|uniref:TetR/AcrR family transcriptional regulator n=1 Tax=Seonamhaeicola maritimus TaxID=2591822 RepID=A0A5C7GJG9_9FLAO|nr:TetR/AcrR family transcriptional regulator [Seonamhaeicola maritimus]TXG38453.1 TetR/AcrR family transcriptional regulator [Seonamhaeicola maritimus]
MPQALNQTYEELVFKAQSLFWKQGYKGVNAKELANHLDVSMSTIYNKYTKDMLFIDSIEYYMNTYSDPFLSQLRASKEGLISLKDFFYALIEALLDKTFPRSCLMVNTVVEMRNENQDVINLYQRYFDALVNSYKVVLEKAIELGQIKHPEKKDDYARFLLGVIFSLSILYKINDKESLQNFIDERLSFIV